MISKKREQESMASLGIKLFYPIASILIKSCPILIKRRVNLIFVDSRQILLLSCPVQLGGSLTCARVEFFAYLATHGMQL